MEPEHRLIAKHTLSHGKIIRVLSPLFWFTKLFWFQYKEHKVCLTKKTTNVIFKILSAIYFQKNVHCDMRFLVENNSALLCFLDGFGTAVPVFSY